MIGIIGGIAPFAGLNTVKKIIEETNASKESEHLPVLLSSQPNRIPDIKGFCQEQSDTNPAHAIADIASQLDKAGVTIVAVASTIVHSPKIFNILKDEIKSKSPNVILVNMIEEVAKYIISNHNEEPIGILATQDLINEEIYKNIFTSYDIQTIEPSTGMQEKIQEALYDENFGIIHHFSPITHRAHDLIISATEDLKKNGAKVIILANPEFLFALRDEEMFGLPLIDPNRILARSLINIYAPEKIKPLM